MRLDRNRMASSRQRGLTLIELLVAITVLASVAVLGWRGLDGIVRARIKLAADLEQTRGMQLAFAQLQSDSAHLAPEWLIPGRMPLLAEAGRLKLIRTVSEDSQPTRLQVVTYRLGDGTLTRHGSQETRDLRELDMLWQSGGTDSSGAVALLPGVAAFDMRLWSAGSWRSGAEAALAFAAEAPAGGKRPPPPAGLEVTLQMQERDARLIKTFLLGAV